jgi:hypothetical protein
MIKNNVEASRKALEILHRLEHGEIDIEMAKALYKGLDVYAKQCIIEGVKHKMGIHYLPTEQPTKESCKMYLRKPKKLTIK